jgi:hypothetical protein
MAFCVATTLSYSQLQQNSPPPPYVHPQANVQPYDYDPSLPPDDIFYNSTGHVNQPFPASTNPQQQQSPDYQNGFPPSPHPDASQYPDPTHHVPTHHSQTSMNSAPTDVNEQPIQITQFAHGHNGSHTRGALSRNIVHQPSSHQSIPPQVDNQTAVAQADLLLGAPVMLLSPSVSSGANCEDFRFFLLYI